MFSQQILANKLNTLWNHLHLNCNASDKNTTRFQVFSFTQLTF